jgi:hypothetical protein
MEEAIPLEKATLFRFPLRTDKMADKSKLSAHRISGYMVTKLLNNLQEEIFDILIFTNNIKEVCFFGTIVIFLIILKYYYVKLNFFFLKVNGSQHSLIQIILY